MGEIKKIEILLTRAEKVRYSPGMSLDKPHRIQDRKAVMAARRDECEICGLWTGNFAHVHHIRTRGAGGNDVPENLISLCWKCHEKVHRGLLKVKR